MDEEGKFCDPFFKHDEISSIINENNPLIDYKERFKKSKNIEDNKEDEEDKYEKRKKDLEKEKKSYQDLFDKKLIRWERISNLIKEEKEMDKNIKISQGNLGDCYLIAFLRGFLKFQQEKYYKLFGNCDIQKGYYEVIFFDNNGDNIIVYVDDYIIVDNLTQPFFSRVEEKDKYIIGIGLIIEKAYAKYNGGYINIKGEYQLNSSYYYFTGIPSKTIINLNLFSNENINDMVESDLERKNVVTCGTKKLDPFPISGIVGNHAYTIMEFEENNDVKIFKINNPWGYNQKDKMKNFELKNLEDDKYKEVKDEIKEFNEKDSNLENGDLKIDVENFKNNFYKINFIEFAKDFKSFGNSNLEIKRNPIPLNLPEDGLDDTDEIFQSRKGLLGSIGVKEEEQKEFFMKFRNYPELGLYTLFKCFMNYGTNRLVFSQFMSSISNTSNNQSTFSADILNIIKSLNFSINTK